MIRYGAILIKWTIEENEKASKRKCRALHPEVRIQEKTLTKYEVRIQETQNWQKTKTLY